MIESITLGRVVYNIGTTRDADSRPQYRSLPGVVKLSNQPDPSTLKNLALFAGLEERDIRWLAERLHSKTFPADTSIMTVEQPGEVVYIIMTGTVKVHIEQAGGSDVVLAILGSGDTVGEMGMLDSAGRSASVDTLEKSTVLWMDRP